MLSIVAATVYTLTLLFANARYVRYNERTTTFWEAQRLCALKGGKLWEPKTEEDLIYGIGLGCPRISMPIDKFHESSKSIPGSGIIGYWIGAYNFPDGRRNWHFITSGTNFTESQYPQNQYPHYNNFDKFWCPGEPSNYRGDEHCVFVAYRGNGIFCLEDLSCHLSACVGCETPQPLIGYICDEP